MPDGIGYNVSMQPKKDIMSLLRVASLLWAAYLGVSAVIDYTLKSPGVTGQKHISTSVMGQ